MNDKKSLYNHIAKTRECSLILAFWHYLIYHQITKIKHKTNGNARKNGHSRISLSSILHHKKYDHKTKNGGHYLPALIRLYIYIIILIIMLLFTNNIYYLLDYILILAISDYILIRSLFYYLE